MAAQLFGGLLKTGKNILESNNQIYINTMDYNIAAVDLFAGVGGLSYGLQRAGIPVVAGVDSDGDCEYPFEQNVRGDFLQRDVGAVLDDWPGTDIDPLDVDELASLYPEREESVHILVGCAPCQPFSDLNNGQDAADPEKWDLLRAMSRVVEELPIDIDIVAIENVPGAAEAEVYTDVFRPWFENNGYNVWEGVVDCTDYGIPQTRDRFVMLASRLGDIELLDPTRTEDDIVTVRRAFADHDLTDIGAGEYDPECHFLHKAAGLQGDNPTRMRATEEGEHWQHLPEDLKPASADGSSYVSYGRMWWDEPAPTLTTNFYNWGSGRFGHPGYDDDPAKSIDRAISAFEAAILQTFPPDFEFLPPDEEPQLTRLGQLIGNAVPPRLGAVIGGSIRRHLDVHNIDATFIGADSGAKSDDDAAVSSDDQVVPPLPNSGSGTFPVADD